MPNRTEQKSPLDGMTVFEYDAYQDQLTALLDGTDHATSAGYVRGCRCAGCRLARREYVRSLRQAHAALRRGKERRHG